VLDWYSGLGITLFGFVHSEFTRSRQFYKALGVEEKEDDFPEDPRGTGDYKNVPDKGWVCLWFPTVMKLRQPKNKLVVIATGAEIGLPVGIERDVERLKTRFKNADVKCMRILAEKTTEKKLLDFLRKRKDQGITKVIFYYTGHGGTTKESDYPSYIGENELVSLAKIHQFTKENFDMSVVGADCCNSAPLVSPVQRAPEYDRYPPFKVDPFSGKGHLLFSSSKVGQVSYGISDGGYFTTTFLQEFEGYWEQGFKSTVARLVKLTTSHSIAVQQPQWTGDLIQLIPRNIPTQEEVDFDFATDL